MERRFGPRGKGETKRQMTLELDKATRREKSSKRSIGDRAGGLTKESKSLSSTDRVMLRRRETGNGAFSREQVYWRAVSAGVGHQKRPDATTAITSSIEGWLKAFEEKKIGSWERGKSALAEEGGAFYWRNGREGGNRFRTLP